MGQEQAISFASVHGMMFFETSAKNPPLKCVNGQRASSKGSYQQEDVEDIVLALAAKLKRQKNHSSVNAAAHNGSFKVLNKKNPEKDFWTCC